VSSFTARESLVPWQAASTELLSDLIWIVDVVFASIGYAATLRLFDTHIKSVDATLLGWLVCLLPYEPIWDGIRLAYFDYSGVAEAAGGSWLSADPVLGMVGGTTYMCFLLVYSTTNLAFGLRFSNLTHRGIITSGPFQFTKHPAYFCKNVTWWILLMPTLLGGDRADAFRAFVLLAFVSGIYALRAWTEERHLLQDRAYVEYALWIEKYGIFSWLVPLCPWLSFTRLHPEVLPMLR
jgi:protein-S-isoprenylcysteine O-methyltransferase Ste14